jgi:hypothetical protein
MKITYKNYQIIPTGQLAPGRYDLYETKTVTVKEGRRAKKGFAVGESYEVTDDIGYGMTLENAIESIIHLEVDKGNGVTELDAFLIVYKEAVRRLKNDIKTIK